MAEEVVVEPERKEKRKEKNPPAAFSLHQHRYQSVVLPIASIIYEAATRNMTADSC